MTRVKLDTAKCQGHGRCSLEAPDIFDVDDIGKSVLLVDEVGEDQLSEVKGAVIACPERAISIDG